VGLLLVSFSCSSLSGANVWAKAFKEPFPFLALHLVPRLTPLVVSSTPLPTWGLFEPYAFFSPATSLLSGPGLFSEIFFLRCPPTPGSAPVCLVVSGFLDTLRRVFEVFTLFGGSSRATRVPLLFFWTVTAPAPGSPSFFQVGIKGVVIFIVPC